MPGTGRSKTLLSTLLGAALLASCASEVFAERGPRGELETLFRWAHEFPGSLNHLEITPQGYIHAVSRYGEKVKIGGKKGYRTKRFLMQGKQVLWEGEASETTYLGDSPHPLVLESRPEGVAVQALQASGAPLWRRVLQGVPAAWSVEPEARTLALLLMPVGWTRTTDQAQAATLAALDTRDGALRWSVPLGEVRGGLDSFGSELAIEGGGVWWAAGGLAARVDLAGGKLSWSAPIPQTQGPNSLWALSGSMAAVARGESLSGLDAASGPKWERRLLEGGRVSGLLWTQAGLLAKFQTDKSVLLAMLDPRSGETRWERRLKHKPGKEGGPPPSGMAVTGARVVLAADARLYAYDLESGSELFDHKMERELLWKAQTATNLQELRARKEHLVVVGRRTASAFSLQDGRPLWRKEGYEPPQDVARRMRQGGLQVGFQSYHQLSPSYTSSEAAAKAREAGRYGDGSYQHQSLLQSAENLQMQHAASQGAAQGSSAAGWIAKIAEVDLQLDNRRFPPRYAAFYKLLGAKVFAMQSTEKVAAVLLDLDSGEAREVRLPDSATACVSQVILDPAGKRFLLTYQQMGLMCKDEDLVEEYALPD